MKPPRFHYHDPQTTADVISLISTYENVKLLAGGQSLMAMLNMRFVLPDHVVDLNRVENLAYVSMGDDALEIGAMTRQRDLEFSEVVGGRFPLMREAIAHVGHRQTRNRGTLGGSLCHMDPAAELVAVAAACDATVTIVGTRGSREIAFADFPVAYMTPDIEPDELLTGVRFPLWKSGHGYAFVEFARRHGDFAVVSAAALLEEDGSGKISRASLTIGGTGPAPVRIVEVERALVGQRASGALFREACEHCRRIDAMGDVHAPASYRQHLAAVLSRRALEKAHARLTAAREK